MILSVLGILLVGVAVPVLMLVGGPVVLGRRRRRTIDQIYADIPRRTGIRPLTSWRPPSWRRPPERLGVKPEEPDSQKV